MMQKAVRPFDISQIEIAVLTAAIASLFSITQSRSIAPASSKGVERHSEPAILQLPSSSSVAG